MNGELIMLHVTGASMRHQTTMFQIKWCDWTLHLNDIRIICHPIHILGLQDKDGMWIGLNKFEVPVIH